MGGESVDLLAIEQDSSPLLGNRAPLIRLKTVVLPAPFGPITDLVCPLDTDRLSLSTATRPRNFLVTL